jgi:protein-disulfide isomerase
VAGAPALGPADQVVTLVEFSDYECPFCVRHFSQTMPQIVERLIGTGQIRYVFQDFPIDQLHPAAARAHEAARCADEQGKFWELHTRLFSPAGSHTDALLGARAAEAGLALPAFTTCLSSGAKKAAVERSVQTAVQLGATGTPSFFVGIRDLSTDKVRVVTAITGAQPFAEFEKAITAVAARIR